MGMKNILTIINNVNHSHKVTSLIDSTSDVLLIARNKLKLPRACKLFGCGGLEYNNSLSVVYVSCGESYQGPDMKLSCKVNIIGTKSSIDTQARKELDNIAGLPGVNAVYGMPDLHAGPTGCVVISENCIYPHLAGSDIGCGMALFKAGKINHFSVDLMKKHIHNIQPVEENTINELLKDNLLAASPEDKNLGTIGAGNHFGEFMMIEKIYDSSKLELLGIGKDDVLLCIHSGSRNLGKKIYDDFGSKSLRDDKIENYIYRHDHAVKWAQINRYIISERLLNKKNPSLILDITHNNIEKINRETSKYNKQWIHRKGAAPGCKGPLIIPGSRGSWSYLVDPIVSENIIEESGLSLAHGAGRRLTRTNAYKRCMKRFGNKLDELKVIKVGGEMSHVVGNNTRVLAEEIPEAYKNIDDVIDDLSPYINLIARFRPILTIKEL